MSLQEHQAASTAAIKHVKSTLKIGAATCPNDVIAARSKGILLNAGVIDAQRLTYRKGPNQTFPDAVREVAERTGIGNCGEQSFVAFEFLRWEHEHLTLAILGSQAVAGFMGIGAMQDWNHQFVVIGASLRKGSALILDRSRPPAWPADAVICDPWLWGVGFTVAVANLAEWSQYCESMLAQTISGQPQQGQFVVREAN